MRNKAPLLNLKSICIVIFFSFYACPYLIAAAAAEPEAGDSMNEPNSVSQGATQNMMKNDAPQTPAFIKSFLTGKAKYKVINLGPIINTSGFEYGPIISPDGQTLYFVSDRQGGIRDYRGNPSHDFWSADRIDLPDSIVFQNIKNIDPYANNGNNNLNTSYNEGVGALIGNQLIFTSCSRPDGLGSCDVYICGKTGEKYDDAEIFDSNVNSKYWDAQPSISMLKDRLYFCSNRPYDSEGFDDSEDIDIWYCDMDSENMTFKPAEYCSEINTDGKDWSPFIFHDGITLFFSSDEYEPNYGGLDLYVTQYDKETKKWSTPVNLGEPFNSEGDECYIAIPAAGNLIYFASTRDDIPGYQGNYDIYVAIPE